ncbi:unnamed protein product [Closterium sp. NIES-53]
MAWDGMMTHGMAWDDMAWDHVATSAVGRREALYTHREKSSQFALPFFSHRDDPWRVLGNIHSRIALQECADVSRRERGGGGGGGGEDVEGQGGGSECLGCWLEETVGGGL